MKQLKRQPKAAGGPDDAETSRLRSIHGGPAHPKVRESDNAITGREKVIVAFFLSHDLPPPLFEWYFHPTRQWRFDVAWPEQRIALEVQGGIWEQGRHTRGAALLKEWEKLNAAAGLGWRVLFCQPADLLTKETALAIWQALKWADKS